MKRLKRVWLSPFIALMILFQTGTALGGFRQDVNGISTMSNANLRWAAQYVNKRNETIVVDVNVVVPDVSTLPVLKVTSYPHMRDDFQLLFRDPQGKTSNSWSCYVADEYVSAFHNWEHGLRAGENPKKQLIQYEMVPTAELDWEKAYAENSDLTFGDAFHFMEETLKNLCMEYGSGNYYPMELERVQIKSIPKDRNGNLLREHGAYTVNCHQRIREIPILMNVSECFSKGLKADSSVPRGYYWNMTTTDSYYFTMSLLEENEVLFEDIPVLSFEQIRPAIEEMIEAGRIRSVYGVRLGYVVFMNEKGNREYFILQPAWVVECEYYDNEKQESADINQGLAYFEQTTYRKLILNAQSGEWIDPKSTDRKRSVAPRVQTW